MALLAIVALGAVMRFAALGTRSFWEDEATTVLLLRESFGDMLSELGDREGSPPLFYVLEWPWAQVFGTSEAAVRALPAVLGVAAIPVMYAAARELFDHRAGLVAALLTAVSPQLIWHAQDARAYSLYVLLAALSFWAFVRARERPDARRVAAWGLASGAALLTHYLAGLLIVVEAAVLLWGTHGAARRRVALGCAVPVAVGAALLPLVLEQRDHGGAFIEGISFPRRLAQLAVEPVVGYQPPAQVPVVLLGGLLVIAALVAARRWVPPERLRGLVLPLGVGVAVVGIAILLAAVGADYVYSRNLLSAWPPLAVAAAGALGAAPVGRAGVALLAAYTVFAGAIVAITADRSKYEHEDWRAAANAVGSAPGGQAVVLPGKGFTPFRVYREDLAPALLPPRVREVAFVFMPPRYRDIGERPRPPRPALAAPPGFVPAERREAPTYTLIRFRADRPTPVDPTALERTAEAADDRNAVVLVGPARR